MVAIIRNSEGIGGMIEKCLKRLGIQVRKQGRLL